jgi:hypothetical protein
MAEYQLCKTLAIPMYHEVNQVICGHARHFHRLLLCRWSTRPARWFGWSTEFAART